MPPTDPALETQGINRNYLHDEVANRLRALIQSGELKPAERLNEGALAARFGISRTPLREAIKILATEGLLDILPSRGAHVASISHAEIEEMIEVLAGLEAMAGELACRTASRAEIDAIAELHARMAEAHEQRDAPGFFELNRLIHEAIMAASRNGTLQAIYAKLSGRIQRARFTAYNTPEQWQQALAEHERIVELLRERDGEALRRLMRKHVRNKKQVIAATFRSE